MKKIRLKLFFSAAFSVFVVLFSIIFALNVSNWVNLKNDSRTTCEKLLYLKNQPHVVEKMDPELLFRSRYFIATYSDNNLVELDTTKVIRISSEEANAIANNVIKKGKDYGFKNSYYFLKTNEDGKTKYIFLDREHEINIFKHDLQTSIVVASCGYLLVLLLVHFSSFLIVKPLEEANTKQKQFITDASHELKTPLTVINSNLSIIEMENGSSDWIDSSKKQVARLSKMTNQLIMLSRLDEDDLALEKTIINLESILMEITQPYLHLLKEKNINLQYDLESSLTINADESLILQMFNALFDNMVKYAYSGNAKITTRKIKNKIHVDIENQIKPDSTINTDIIFDRFYKEDKSRNLESNSFGIGLSMVKSIVEIHKGTIEAEVRNNRIIFKIIF